MPLKPERVWRAVHDAHIKPSHNETKATAVLTAAAAAKAARKHGRRA
jgi:hypothetical protein